MKPRYHMRRHQRIGTAAALLFLGTAACAGGPAPERMSTGGEGAQLWRDTCAHCHNLRSAPEFSADEWPVIVTHMRTRAYLTKSEAETVADYLASLRERANSD